MKEHERIIEGLYADPDMIKYNGKYYIYPTTDGFTGWSGTKFHVFSSEDLENWTDEGVIVDVASDQVPWSTGSAWAPAIYEENDKFYFYFCAKRENGDSCIGVAVSNDPKEGFIAEKEPLITPDMMKEFGIEMGQTIDPSIYKEGDEVFLLFGNCNGAIVKLNSDRISIDKATMKNINGAKDLREAITVFKKDGLYHFTWSCDDTGSEDYHVNYGVSKELYGEIEFKYTILKKEPDLDILGTGHHCIYKDKDEYYIVFHRFATPTENYPEGKGFHRELVMETLAFDRDGFIIPVSFK